MSKGVLIVLGCLEYLNFRFIYATRRQGGASNGKHRRKNRRYRQKLGLTQEELASRTELSKGFISQLERDLTSPSIATLTDILEALGTNLSEFLPRPELKR